MRNIRTAILLACTYGQLAVPCAVAQSFYDASNLLPPFDRDIALGASVVDVNADGRVDLYRRNRLYLQEAGGTFTDVFQELGYSFRGGGSFGALFGDANNDGFVETFFMDLDENLPYYLNRHGMRVEEYSNDSGIRTLEIVQGSVWTDYNRDGLLDLFVGIDGGIPDLYRNIGLDFFQNVGAASGFGYSLAYGVAAADYDRDGDPDIMVTQCIPPPGDTLQQNRLFRNDDGTFKNVSDELGITDNRASWGVVWLDYDNDGLLDFYAGNNQQGGPGTSSENTLYRNLGEEGFQDVTAEAGVGRTAYSQTIAVAAGDFDNDGWIDLFVTDSDPLQPALFRNNGDGTFTDIWPQLALPTINSTAAAVGDVNGDGWIDIFQPSTESDQLIMNLGGENHFLVISLRGTTSNHFGVGARVDLYADGLHQVREITAGDGMTSQNHNFSAHFGLGSATLADSVIVRWPSGAVDRIENVTADQFLTIVENVGLNKPPAPFALTGPTGGGISSHAETLTFSWTPAEDNEDPVLYSLHVFGPGVDNAITDISETAAVVERSSFRNGATYRWTVSATDGYSVRAARYAKFVFGPTTSAEPENELPSVITRFEVYPNPVVRSAHLDVELATSEHIRINVFDVAGKEVARIQDGPLPAGPHRFEWTPQYAAPGTYLVRLHSQFGSTTRGLVVN